MNKAQIEYFKERVARAKRTIEKHFYDVRQREHLTMEDKVAQIMNGKARFKIELFAEDNCPSNMQALYSFFEFEGEDDLKAKNLVSKAKMDEDLKKVKNELDDIEMKFVFKTPDFDGVAELQKLIDKYTTEKEGATK